MDNLLQEQTTLERRGDLSKSIEDVQEIIEMLYKARKTIVAS